MLPMQKNKDQLKLEIDQRLSLSSYCSIFTSTGGVFVYPKYLKGFLLASLSDQLIALRLYGGQDVYISHPCQIGQSGHL